MLCHVYVISHAMSCPCHLSCDVISMSCQWYHINFIMMDSRHVTSHHVMWSHVKVCHTASHVISPPSPPPYIRIYNELMNLTCGHLYIMVSDNMYNVHVVRHTSLANNFTSHATAMGSTVAKVFLTAHGMQWCLHTTSSKAGLSVGVTAPVLLFA